MNRLPHEQMCIIHKGEQRCSVAGQGQQAKSNVSGWLVYWDAGLWPAVQTWEDRSGRDGWRTWASKTTWSDSILDSSVEGICLLLAFTQYPYSLRAGFGRSTLNFKSRTSFCLHRKWERYSWTPGVTARTHANVCEELLPVSVSYLHGYSHCFEKGRRIQEKLETLSIVHKGIYRDKEWRQWSRLVHWIYWVWAVRRDGEFKTRIMGDLNMIMKSEDVADEITPKSSFPRPGRMPGRVSWRGSFCWFVQLGEE